MDTQKIVFAPSKLKKLRRLLSQNKELYDVYLKTLDYIEKLNELMPAFPKMLHEEGNREKFNSLLNQFKSINFNEPIPGLDPIWLKNVSISSFTHVEYIVMDKHNL